MLGGKKLNQMIHAHIHANIYELLETRKDNKVDIDVLVGESRKVQTPKIQHAQLTIIPTN